VNEGRDDLTPDQRKAHVRIQVVAVVVLIAVLVAMNVVDRETDIVWWKVLAVGFGVMIVLASIATLAVSRVERRPFRQVCRDSARGVVDDMKNAPSRLRQRIDDALGRPHSR
jgi:hypothetical protein